MPALTAAAWAHLLAASGAVAVALACDRLFGEPPARGHPVVAMGRYLAWAGRWAAPAVVAAPTATSATAAATPARDLPAFGRGAVAWLLGAAGVLALAIGAQHAAVAYLPPWGQALLLGLLLKPMLAWRMLCDEVRAVDAALARSLPEGQARLVWLVSRDTATLDADLVRQSAIESLAENLNDSLVAPLCWFVVAGLPGAVLYRFANTADAMWGYPQARGGRQWAWAGCWAARADDALSWLPARITALLLLGLAGARHLRALPAEARRTPSPNSGWPMAAMALLLGVRLGKPGSYTLCPGARGTEPADVGRALIHGQKLWFRLIPWTFLALYLIAIAF